MRRRNQRGLTLVELVVAFTIMLVLTTMAVPLARSKVRAERERSLRRALVEMRGAIDKYKDYADRGYLGPTKLGTNNYPETLDVLVEGVKLPGPDGKKMRFLRRIPQDPFTGKTEWGLRSDQDDPKSQSWGGQCVFDVYSKTTEKAPMAHLIQSGKRGRRGFTFVEIMVVITIIVILISMAIPIYSRSILRAKESVLKNNLFTLRTVIDNYTYDKQKAPQSLDDLVSDGYLQKLPMDPMTGSNQSWRTIMEDASQSVNQSEPGIFDVKSSSDKIGLDGTPYSDW